MKNKLRLFSKQIKSGFVRSVITRVLAIFIIVSIIIAAVTFYSFTSEIRASTLRDRQTQLFNVAQTISNRMDEINSIAYHIGQDSIFYFEPIASDPTSGLELSNTLGRYLVGNNFIEHMAYCRTAEPDTIYVSTGERSLKEFLMTNFSLDDTTASLYISAIQEANQTQMIVYGTGENAYFAYLYPLPQLAVKPKAHVLMLIPTKTIQPLMDTLFINGNGAAAAFDATGDQIYQTGDLEESIDLTAFVQNDAQEETYKSPSGQKYVLQKVQSDSNGWTYVSVMRYSDTLSGLENKQLAFIVLILLLLVLAIVLMLMSVITQYQPIRKLAAQVAGTDAQLPQDERALLSNTIATLQDDSQQKQKFETAYHEAEAASKAKSAFLSSMSHDIRTPMNAIIGMTAIARKHINDQAYVDDCLKNVQVSSEYLLDIINNVLDMSRIESGRIPIVSEPVVIPALIDSVVSLITTSVEAKAQTLTVDLGETTAQPVIGDSIHLVQVFVNIVSNAVKFTPEGGTLSIAVQQLPSDDPNAADFTFRFTDTGIGIPPEFIGQVFDTFSRADSAATLKTEGTGLGMAIAKHLVELMGGTIACESQLGQGTTFTVNIHMEYAAESEPLSHSSAAEQLHANYNAPDALDLTGRRILLTEDNAMNREIATRIISETGAEVVEAMDGQEAVAAFRDHPADYFDLIFMDIQMPVMNGYEATARIRSMSRPDAATIPIYAMTANTFDEDIRQVKAAGMNGHIGKPYHPAMLFQVLSQALGGRKDAR